MDWPGFFGGLHAAYGDRAPTFVVAVLALLVVLGIVYAFLRALNKITTRQEHSEERLDVVFVQPLQSLTRQIEDQREESRVESREHLRLIREIVAHVDGLRMAMEQGFRTLMAEIHALYRHRGEDWP